VRAGIGTVAMVLFWTVILVPVFGHVTFNPARGARANWLFHTTTLVEVWSTLFLTFLVADATLYSRAFIKRLAAINTRWSDTTFDKYREIFNLHHADNLADWVDLRFLAERTRSITQLVYFPFLALAVLIFSRSPLFDDSAISLTLVIGQAANLAIIIGAVLAYRSTAEYARRLACKHVTTRIIAAKGRGDDAIADQLERLLAEMRDLSEGAFAPWSSQPLVRAVLLPLLTYGGTLLVHAYALPGT
jgi:hypothetical protein